MNRITFSILSIFLCLTLFGQKEVAISSDLSKVTVFFLGAQIEHQATKSLIKGKQEIVFTKLTDFVKQEYQEHQVFPPGKQIFSAFWQCPLPSVKVVILGQDPYHGEGQANGLAFSVAPGLPFPPSLLNIFKELKADLGIPMPPNGDLSRWAAQGVFLLNATLTVRANSAGSHQNQGWESVTDAVIQTISRE